MPKTDELLDVTETVFPAAVRPPERRRRLLRRPPPTAAVVSALGLAAAVLVLSGTPWLNDPAVAAWRTVCLAITVQALPFLLLGTALSGAINAFVPADLFTKVLPKHPALAVPVAGVAGAVLPGCECASVPVANSLRSGGVSPRPPRSRSCSRRPRSTRSC